MKAKADEATSGVQEDLSVMKTKIVDSVQAGKKTFKEGFSETHAETNQPDQTRDHS